MSYSSSHFTFYMKKHLLISILILSCFLSNAQERYFNLYPGWSVRFAYERDNSFYLSGLDTIFEYNSNTPIHNLTSKNGELIESHRNVSDTIYGFSF